MMYGWNDGSGYGYSIWGSVFMSLLMFLFVVGIVWCVHYFGHHHHNHCVPDTKEEALSILKKRYASGEIDKKEFEEKRKDLSA